MRRDAKDIRGRIPPGTQRPNQDESRGYVWEHAPISKTLEQNWALTEAKVYNAIYELTLLHDKLTADSNFSSETMQAGMKEITPIEQTAINLYGNWIFYGWEKTKPMVRKIYPAIVNESITSMTNGIGKEM